MERLNQTRFLSSEELKGLYNRISKKSKTENSIDLLRGGIPMLADKDNIYIDTSESHSVVFGATGSRKTRMIVMPTIEILSRAGESFLVTDPKGEICDYTIENVKKRGYTTTVIDLRKMDSEKGWNPLMLPYLTYKTYTEKSCEMVDQISQMLMQNGDVEDKFWTTNATDVMSGLIFALFEVGAPEDINIKGLMKMWDGYLSMKSKFLQGLKDNCKNELVAKKMSCLYTASDKTSGSIEAFLHMAFNRLSLNPGLVEYLSKPSIRVDEILDGKNGIYIIVPDENNYYHFIASLFISQLYEVMIEKAQNSRNRMLPVRMNLLIDEFANMPKISNISQMITAARSRNIRITLIVQSYRQLKNIYKDEADIIIGNCNNWIYLYSKEYELLQMISRLCGEVIYDEARMPLISEFELQHLSKERGEVLILAERTLPCISNLIDISEYIDTVDVKYGGQIWNLEQWDM